MILADGKPIGCDPHRGWCRFEPTGRSSCRTRPGLRCGTASVRQHRIGIQPSSYPVRPCSVCRPRGRPGCELSSRETRPSRAEPGRASRGVSGLEAGVSRTARFVSRVPSPDVVISLLFHSGLKRKKEAVSFFLRSPPPFSPHFLFDGEDGEQVVRIGTGSVSTD